MECTEAIRILGLAHDGRLPTSDRARLDDHVNDCASCADERRWLARLVGVSESLVDREIPPDLADRITKSVFSSPRPQLVARKSAPRWALAASLAACLLVGGAVGSWVAPKRPVVEAKSTVIQQDESTFRTLLRDTLGLDAVAAERLIEIRRRHDALLSDAERRHEETRGRLERAEIDDLWKALPEAARIRLTQIDPHFVPANPAGR